MAIITIVSVEHTNVYRYIMVVVEVQYVKLLRYKLKEITEWQIKISILSRIKLKN